MRRKIPSTAALIAFEAAARQQSFTKAAEELALTQSAICRQIASLESFLGLELFRRSRRGVKLTDAGRSYAHRVAAQLDAVERDTLAMMGGGAAGRIELAVVPTFATQWLVPRLADFHAKNPGIRVNLTNRTRPFLFADTEFDAALYFGDGEWSGTEAHFLMHENPVPVASPALLAQYPELTAHTLSALPLLQQSTRPYAWRQWFESLKMQVPGDMNGPRYELFSMLAQAAIHSMGVALIPPFLIADELAQGRLCLALEHHYISDKAYYLMIPERRSESRSVALLRDWLLVQAQAFASAQGLAAKGGAEKCDKSPL